MSSGELCESKVWISAGGLNSIAGSWHSCGRYVGHEGQHEVALICVQNNPRGHLDNHRVGRIVWGDDIAGKQPVAPS